MRIRKGGWHENKKPPPSPPPLSFYALLPLPWVLYGLVPDFHAQIYPGWRIQRLRPKIISACAQKACYAGYSILDKLISCTRQMQKIYIK